MNTHYWIENGYMLQDCDSDSSFNSSLGNEIKRVEFQGHVSSNSEQKCRLHDKSKKICKNSDFARSFRKRKKEELKGLELVESRLKKELADKKITIDGAIREIVQKFKRLDVHKGRFIEDKLTLGRQAMSCISRLSSFHTQEPIVNTKQNTVKTELITDQSLLKLITDNYMHKFGLVGGLKWTVIERLKGEWLRLIQSGNIANKIDINKICQRFVQMFIQVDRRVKNMDFLTRELQQLIKPQYFIHFVLPNELLKNTQEIEKNN